MKVPHVSKPTHKDQIRFADPKRLPARSGVRVPKFWISGGLSISRAAEGAAFYCDAIPAKATDYLVCPSLLSIQ
jgi:hypothetical protein